MNSSLREDDFRERKTSGRELQNSKKRLVNPTNTNKAFISDLEALKKYHSECQQIDYVTLAYIVVFLESIFDEYIRNTIRYRLEILFERPDLADGFSESLKDFRVPLISIAQARESEHPDAMLSSIIRNELRYRSFLSYNTLVESCNQVGIEEAVFSPWRTDIDALFKMRSQIVHHGGKDGSYQVDLKKENVKKYLDSIEKTQVAIQKKIIELDKDYYRQS